MVDWIQMGRGGGFIGVQCGPTLVDHCPAGVPCAVGARGRGHRRGTGLRAWGPQWTHGPHLNPVKHTWVTKLNPVHFDVTQCLKFGVTQCIGFVGESAVNVSTQCWHAVQYVQVDERNSSVVVVYKIRIGKQAHICLGFRWGFIGEGSTVGPTLTWTRAPKARVHERGAHSGPLSHGPPTWILSSIRGPFVLPLGTSVTITSIVSSQNASLKTSKIFSNASPKPGKRTF